ncbi:3-dehydroquinate synthase [Actinacidiphila sp. bgisy145]|uniref:3-dehydroquinate synthase n=1 Tax=Actinacidiphila sp. bgisy145 TaxID=3413792 RepID=UPI003EBF0A21
MTTTASRLEVAHGADGGFDVTARRADRYRIHLENGLTDRLADHLRELVAALDAHRIVLTMDTVVAAHHLSSVSAVLARVGVPFDVVLVAEGEATKSQSGLQGLWRSLQRVKATRRTLVLGVGGGMVCDLTTAAAATYMRGVPYALVPTTLLAQVDAAIGGKGGINYDGTKNLVGAFQHPAAVFVDPELIRTLPDQHIRNGLAEVVKVALIADPGLFAVLERSVGRGAATWPWDAIIRAAITAKLLLLAPDPFEQADLRRLLNLGHCVGHPYEAAAGFRVLHGEAVAAGLAVATALSLHGGHCTRGDHDRILAVLSGHRLPTTVPAPLRADVWDALEAVRRVRNGHLHLVVPAAPGHCTVVDDVTREAFDRALRHLDRRCRP